MSQRERRQALKATILAGLSTFVQQEAWERWLDEAEDLGLTEATMDSVIAEIGDELWRRAVRLPGRDEALMNQAREDSIAMSYRAEKNL